MHGVESRVSKIADHGIGEGGLEGGEDGALRSRARARGTLRVGGHPVLGIGRDALAGLRALVAGT